jgi:hypothetical protein
MTYRELVNKLSDEEFAQTILDDVLIHMACNCSIVDNKPVCPQPQPDCLKCIVKLLRSEVENLDEI